MAFDRTKLINALDVLKRYYGISDVDDLLKTIALQSVISNPVEQQTATRPVEQNNLEETEILKTVFHDRTALFSSKAIIGKIATIATTDAVLSRFNQTFQIFNELQTNGMERLITNTNGQATFLGTSRNFSQISDIISNPDGLSDNRIINVGEPTKTNPGLSVFLCNTHRLSFNQFYGDLLTVWLNGIPTHEIAKSTPFFTIEFNTPRATIDNQGRLSAMGLNKFIYGAKQTNEGDPFQVTTKANQSTLNAGGSTRESTIVGMELFTSPVTLAPSRNLQTAEHSIRVLDSLQPFLSIEDLAINVAPSTGLMSFKTATLTMRLHDRSRLADIAEFIRPEYFGLNEIMIEYGWIHQDAELASANRNPYADIINNIRVKEKYCIMNSSYNFDGSGGTKISLELAMRGSTEMFTETIASNQSSLQNIMEEIQIIRGTIEAIRSRFPDGRVLGREIRGFDIINNLSDSSFNFTVGKEFLTDLSRIRTTVSRVPQLSELSSAIDRLISQGGNGGFIRDVQRTVLQEVQLKIANLLGTNSEDPMLLTVADDLSVVQATSIQRAQSGSYAQLPTTGPSSTAIRDALAALGVTDASNTLPNGQFSLAKLLLEFVGVPLAATRKYDDIQLIFYPFNVYAGRANRLNIGNFGIDARFFLIKYMEWRLGRLNQSMNVSLHEFMRFVIDQIVAEPSSKSYGLYKAESESGHGGGINRGFRYYVENGSIQTRPEEPNGRRGTQAESDGGSYLQQISHALENVTPNAEFRPPQIEFHIESLPLKYMEGPIEVIDPSKTVLRMHIFDRAATSLDNLSQIEMAARDSSIQSIGTAWSQAQSSIRNIGATDPDHHVTRQEAAISTDVEANRIIQSARESLEQTIRNAVADGIIKQVASTPAIPSTNGVDGSQLDEQVHYKFIGGPERIREFFRKNSPHMLYGAAGTTVKNASFHSLNQGNSELSTVNMLRTTTRSELESNGENPGGLPMQVSPGRCELTILGNPLISYAQSLFCDFQTGTTIDNFYAIVSVKHALAAGKFETKLELTPVDGWGKYISVSNVINSYANQINELSTQANAELESLRLANRPTSTRR